MKKIYLIRHGQTDYNLKGIVQGSGVNASLNDTGRLQALAFYEKYQSTPFKKVYTSALNRSIESVQKFIDAGIPWESYAGLNEISWGNRDGKIVGPEDDKFYKEVVGEWKKGNVHICSEGGESPLDVEKRIQEVMNIIFSRQEEDVILICMHGRAMRILLASLLKKDLKYMDEFIHENLCLYVINFSNGEFLIEKSSDVEHLGKLK